MLRVLKLALSLAAPIALVGCGAIGALNSAAEPNKGFELRLPEAMPIARNTGRAQVIVEVPETSGGLTSNGVMIRTDAVGASFLPAAQWTDDVPLMVQTLLVRALQASDGYAYVGREPLGLSGDYAILTELVDFQAQISPAQTAEAAQTITSEVTLNLHVVRTSDAAIMGSKTFISTIIANSDSAADITAALNTATSDLLPEISRWIMGSTGVTY